MDIYEQVNMAHDQWEKNFLAKAVPLTNQAYEALNKNDWWSYYKLMSKYDTITKDLDKRLRKVHKKFYKEVCDLDIDNIPSELQKMIQTIYSDGRMTKYCYDKFMEHSTIG